MSEPSPIILSSPDPGSRGAGEVLKRARESQGMTLEALASMIKVTPVKLDALEQGRYDLLPDANFTRALAMTVCRALKVDPGEILPSLPAARPAPLAEGKPPLNQPFKESRGGAHLFDRHALSGSALLHVKYLAPLGLLIAAALIYFLPDSVLKPGWFGTSPQESQEAAPAEPIVVAPGVVSEVVPQPSVPATAAETASAVPSLESGASAAPAAPAPLPGAPAPLKLDVSPVGGAVAPTPAPVPAPAAPAAVTTPAPALSPSTELSTGALSFTATAPAWIEVRDGGGARVFSRLVQAGENITLNGPLPLNMRIGNVSGVQVRFKGQPVDLSAFSRNNVARIELK